MHPHPFRDHIHLCLHVKHGSCMLDRKCKTLQSVGICSISGSLLCTMCKASTLPHRAYCFLTPCAGITHIAWDNHHDINAGDSAATFLCCKFLQHSSTPLPQLHNRALQPAGCDHYLFCFPRVLPLGNCLSLVPVTCSTWQQCITSHKQCWPTGVSLHTVVVPLQPT